jgi:C_GCAxxG_C_C family probable redox protein
MTRAEEAESLFNSGMNCCQAVLMTFAETYGLSRNDAMRLGSGFGGGMGRMGETCGALTGAYMAIGLAHPRPNRQSAEPSAQLVQKLNWQFCKKHGSSACRQLLGEDISTPEGHERAKEQKLFQTICPKLVHDAAEIVETLLKEQPATGSRAT